MLFEVSTSSNVFWAFLGLKEKVWEFLKKGVAEVGWYP
ncbi:hypothetical protein U713_16705 [Rhodobacter capsulatus YW2]|nr:hypothetical protein U713_16705 [Rhodobacter capsulatus YW2]